MSFIQSVFLGFSVLGLLINWIQDNTNGILFNGVILICLFLSYILISINELSR